MTDHPRLLDAYCCQGGASAGYVAAGFDVTGVDLYPQPRYPHRFIQGDAVTFIRDHGHEFAAIHVSPPCQRRTKAQRIRGNEHPALIAPTRVALQSTGRPWVIENVPPEGADDDPLINPITLCGAMFGLHTYRHRQFESSHLIVPPPHPRHIAVTVKMGRPLRSGDWYHAVGNFSNVPYVRADLDVPWMSRDGIRECIPPAYAERVGRALMAHVRTAGRIPA